MIAALLFFCVLSLLFFVFMRWLKAHDSQAINRILRLIVLAVLCSIAGIFIATGRIAPGILLLVAIVLVYVIFFRGGRES